MGSGMYCVCVFPGVVLPGAGRVVAVDDVN